MKIKIKVMLMTKTQGRKEFTIIGKIDYNVNKLLPVKSHLDEHDIGAALFAIEFAANQNENIPMRVHIEEVE